MLAVVATVAERANALTANARPATRAVALAADGRESESEGALLVLRHRLENLCHGEQVPWLKDTWRRLELDERPVRPARRGTFRDGAAAAAGINPRIARVAPPTRSAGTAAVQADAAASAGASRNAGDRARERPRAAVAVEARVAEAAAVAARAAARAAAWARYRGRASVAFETRIAVAPTCSAADGTSAGMLLACQGSAIRVQAIPLEQMPLPEQFAKHESSSSHSRPRKPG